MTYLQEPIDVLVFDKLFRKSRPELSERKAVLVGFKQNEQRWTATYQVDDEISIAFEGDVMRTLEFLACVEE